MVSGRQHQTCRAVVDNVCRAAFQGSIHRQAAGKRFNLDLCQTLKKTGEKKYVRLLHQQRNFASRFLPENLHRLGELTDDFIGNFPGADDQEVSM